MARVVLALGSNLGDCHARLEAAREALATLPNVNVLACAKEYETEPVDVPEAYAMMKFLNSAVLVETSLSPEALLDALQRLEAQQGRVRLERNGPRTLDIDIIMYEGIVQATERLILPHPRAAEREFVLQPLSDLGLTREDVLLNRFPSEE